mgnify:CR=1 FL=1
MHTYVVIGVLYDVLHFRKRTDPQSSSVSAAKLTKSGKHNRENVQDEATEATLKQKLIIM